MKLPFLVLLTVFALSAIAQSPRTNTEELSGPAPELKGHKGWLNTGKPLTIAELKGKVVLLPTADRYLRELALLANAYPKAGVVLDGYSKAYKNSKKDRELASLYAWQTYSYLVKKGNVKASRITVRGRGRSATFHRRAAGVDFLKNGVEMVLEGSGPW